MRALFVSMVCPSCGILFKIPFPTFVLSAFIRSSVSDSTGDAPYFPSKKQDEVSFSDITLNSRNSNVVPQSSETLASSSAPDGFRKRPSERRLPRRNTFHYRPTQAPSNQVGAIISTESLVHIVTWFTQTVLSLSKLATPIKTALSCPYPPDRTNSSGKIIRLRKPVIASATKLTAEKISKIG